MSAGRLPEAGPNRCPVDAITTWCELAGIHDGPLLRPVSKGNKAHPKRGLTQPRSTIWSSVPWRAPGLDPDSYSAHSLRAGFVTYAHLRGSPIGQ